VHQRERVEDGGSADAQPQRAGDQAQQVPGLQRSGLREQAGQQLQLAALGAGSFGLGDLVQGVDHLGDRHGGRSAGHPAGHGGGQQLLGGLAEVAGLPHTGGDLLGRVPGRGGHRPDGQLLGEAEIDAREVRREQALAEVADRWQQLVRGPDEQGGHPLYQRQPAGGLLQVAVRLGDGLVLHSRPSARQPVPSRARIPRLTLQWHETCCCPGDGRSATWASRPS